MGSMRNAKNPNSAFFALALLAIGGVVHLFVAAVALMFGGKLLPGLRVLGFTGALVATVVIGALYWLGGLPLGAVI
jgi:uncharacterized membrane protein YvlD (DUF360 family)